MEEEALAEYIKSKWFWFEVKVKVPLKNVFPKPENKGLKHMWKYGHADVVVYHHGKPICIYEPGGSQHLEEKQARNDRRKYMLCKKNDCNCIHMMTGIQNNLSKRKYRQLIRKGLDLS